MSAEVIIINFFLFLKVPLIPWEEMARHLLFNLTITFALKQGLPPMLLCQTAQIWLWQVELSRVVPISGPSLSDAAGMSGSSEQRRYGAMLAAKNCKALSSEKLPGNPHALLQILAPNVSLIQLIFIT